MYLFTCLLAYLLGADPQGADDVHAAIPPRHADHRDAGQTDALCRRSSAVRAARPYRVRSTHVLCCWINSLHVQLAACRHYTVPFSRQFQAPSKDTSF